MALKAYKAVVNGAETTLMLTADDAKARGLTTEKAETDTSAEKKAPSPANKARTAQNKSGDS